MNNQKKFGIPANAIGLFVAALLSASVGLYTNNSGFVLAGAIFFVVSLVVVFQNFYGKE
jgi:hypothetical protein